MRKKRYHKCVDVPRLSQIITYFYVHCTITGVYFKSRTLKQPSKILHLYQIVNFKSEVNHFKKQISALKVHPCIDFSFCLEKNVHFPFQLDQIERFWPQKTVSVNINVFFFKV